MNIMVYSSVFSGLLNGEVACNSDVSFFRLCVLKVCVHNISTVSTSLLIAEILSYCIFIMLISIHHNVCPSLCLVPCA